ncbi:hypothetical protein GCM10011357_12250 [Lacimicrobium alkaliphilum]|uniref:Solute-binding protein family 3/N-terminal domain-containing protein n=2 Tax=Lacimicrobium alkaliphilum TaxID=1526571 RepID=A0ABQ1R503_9ALTE|nr:hypothetical protein GCM10011357_12250 [Lacimicrobium alkaliphilum]
MPVSAFACDSKDSILIYIRDDVYEDYTRVTANRPVTEINDFSVKGMRRDVVDMIIAQQALAEGGFDKSFCYAAGKVNFRNTRLLQQGKLLMSFDSYWYKDALEIEDSVYISSPVIRNGEYVAAIYTRPDNQAVLSIQTASDLASLSAVSTPLWQTDWKTFQTLGLKELVREDDWVSQVQMVYRGWVDFMLMPYLPEQNPYVLEHLSLQPVKDTAVILWGSRHFVISRKHPDGEKAYKAIEKGLNVLRSQQRIKRAYTQAGFFKASEKVNILNPVEN